MSGTTDKVNKAMLKHQRKKSKEQEYSKPKVFDEHDDMAIYTDGGCIRPKEQGDPQCAGWGFVAIERGPGLGHETAREVHSAFGLVTSDSTDGDFEGADAMTNNTHDSREVARHDESGNARHCKDMVGNSKA